MAATDSSSVFANDDIVTLPFDLITELICDKCSEDGYGVENLLSSPTTSTNIRGNVGGLQSLKYGSLFSSNEEMEKMKNCGFMAACFVRTPVTLTWRFRYPIDLQGIYLGLFVGSQKTTGIQLFVGENQDGPEIQRRVALTYFSNTTPPGRCLISRRNSGTVEKICSNFETGGDLEIIHFTKGYLLEKVNVLSVKIVRSYYVPCLAFAKFFVKRLPLDYISRSPEITTSAETSAVIRPFIAPESERPSNEIDESVPDEFFDPLTNQCMSLPIILPSGHTIDRSTLERYLEEETKFGRSANDPFTGVRFTDSSFPIPNGKLKERIDKFFLSCPHLAKQQHYGRTLCGGDSYSAMAGSESGNRNPRKRAAIGQCGKKLPRIEDRKDEKMDRVELNVNSCETPEYLRSLLHDLPSFL